MFDIPIIKQTKISSCGAVCINMLEAARDTQRNEMDVYNKISQGHSNGERLCRTSLMLKYFLDKGYQACIVCVNKYRKVLKACTKNNIHAIMLIRQNTFSPFGHFVVYRGLLDDKVYVNDPAIGDRVRAISVKELKKLAKESAFYGITQKNTLLLVNLNSDIILPQKTVSAYDPYIDNKISGKVFSCIKKYTKRVLLGENEIWKKINK